MVSLRLPRRFAGIFGVYQLKPILQAAPRARQIRPAQFVTLMSIACGFGSIVISVDNAVVGNPADYRLAAILLVLAGVFDALDGYVARATNTSPNSACSSTRSPT